MISRTHFFLSSKVHTLHPVTIRSSSSHTATQQAHERGKYLFTSVQRFLWMQTVHLWKRRRCFGLIEWESPAISRPTRKATCGLSRFAPVTSVRKGWFLFVNFRQAEMWQVFKVWRAEWCIRVDVCVCVCVRDTRYEILDNNWAFGSFPFLQGFLCHSFEKKLQKIGFWWGCSL